MVSSIAHKLDSEHYSSEKLLATLESILSLTPDYDSDAGVSEGYIIREHTLMVLRQFDRYFSHRPLPMSMTVSFWRLLLALHDVLGKPEALRQGNKNLQHQFLRKNLPIAMCKLGYNASDIAIGTELLSSDVIGAYLQDIIDPYKVTIQTQILSKVAHCSKRDALEATIMYWMVDAGSYTKDAGGKESLDSLFFFDHLNNIMRVQKPINQKLQLLENYV